MSVATVYTKGFAKQTGYFAHWLPNSPLTLGTVGYLNRNVFHPMSTLQDLGFQFDPAQDVVEDPSPTPIDFVSSRGVSIDVKLEGETNNSLPNVPKAKAGIRIQFAKEGGFALKAAESYEPRIRDIHRLKQAIERANKEKRWPDNYMVVTSLLHAPYADILISETSNCSIELQAEGDANGAPIELGKVSIGFAVKSISGSILNMLGSRNVNPAFRLWGLKSRWFSAGNKAIAPAGIEPLHFGQIFPAELDDSDM